MVHLYRPRPKTFAFPAGHAAETIVMARPVCTGRGAGGGYEGYRETAAGDDKNGRLAGQSTFFSGR